MAATIRASIATALSKPATIISPPGLSVRRRWQASREKREMRRTAKRDALIVSEASEPEV
ncbi:hypothetical protein [Parvibaculum sp.]|uniref:hypothetical protein n=1 Tax=Parvibaculum sp. TaxID=2024848 RepID=UPI0025F0DB40|nr:hypothetical protein [Parvibaculum sp.]